MALAHLLYEENLNAVMVPHMIAIRFIARMTLLSSNFSPLISMVPS